MNTNTVAFFLLPTYCCSYCYGILDTPGEVYEDFSGSASYKGNVLHRILQSGVFIASFPGLPVCIHNTTLLVKNREGLGAFIT